MEQVLWKQSNIDLPFHSQSVNLGAQNVNLNQQCQQGRALSQVLTEDRKMYFNKSKVDCTAPITPTLELSPLGDTVVMSTVSTRLKQSQHLRQVHRHIQCSCIKFLFSNFQTYKKKELEYSMKVSDSHRDRWKTGDWTDDSDQMLQIMMSLLHTNGEVKKIYWLTPTFVSCLA